MECKRFSEERQMQVLAQFKPSFTVSGYSIQIFKTFIQEPLNPTCF